MFTLDAVPNAGRLLAELQAFRGTPLGQGLEALFAIAGGAAAVVAALYKIYTVVQDVRNAKRLADSAGVRSFSRADFRKARKFYVEPDCSNMDPSNERDLRTAVMVKEPVFGALRAELDPAHGHRHILILADSGMGKTTLLLNLFARRSRHVGRQRTAIVPLNRHDALDQIGRVPEPSETVLLLDALDEDVQAIGDYQSRLRLIMQAAADFNKVVLTCRTQFFESDRAIPEQTGIHRIDPRGLGEQGSYAFRKLYLMPFSETQTRQYIRRRIPIWQVGRRRRAWEYIKNLHDLPYRPMLLTEIPEIAKQRARISEIYQVYKFVVGLWFRRESRWISSDLLNQVSMLLALDLLVNRERRQAESMSTTDLDQLLAKHDIRVDPSERWALTTRSLLNRDSAGRIKFAHRSIMEYFFLEALVTGNRAALSTKWTDQITEFFLSWARGASPAEHAQLVKRIYDEDLSTTGLCPILAARPKTVGHITVAEFNEVANSYTSVPYWRRVPPSLERALVRKQVFGVTNVAGNADTGELHKVYDLAYGLSVVLPVASRGRSGSLAWSHRRWGGGGLTELERDSLPHMHCLGRVLRSIDLAIGVQFAFTSGQLYWLGDGRSNLRYAFRVQTGERASADDGVGVEGIINFVGVDGPAKVEVVRVTDPWARCVAMRLAFKPMAEEFNREYGDSSWAMEYLASAE